MARVRHGGPGAGGRCYRVRPRGPFGPSHLPVTPGPSRYGSGHRLRPPQNRDQTGLRGPPRPRPTGRGVRRAGSWWARGLSGHPLLGASRVRVLSPSARWWPWPRPWQPLCVRPLPPDTGRPPLRRVGTGQTLAQDAAGPPGAEAERGEKRDKLHNAYPPNVAPKRENSRERFSENQPTCRSSGLHEMNQVWDGNAKAPARGQRKETKSEQTDLGKEEKDQNATFSRATPDLWVHTRAHRRERGGTGPGRNHTNEGKGRKRRRGRGWGGATDPYLRPTESTLENTGQSVNSSIFFKSEKMSLNKERFGRTHCSLGKTDPDASTPRLEDPGAWDSQARKEKKA